MSMYVNFYLRINDNFAPIGSYSRNGEVWWACNNHLPWEKIRALNFASFEAMVRTLNVGIQNSKKAIANIDDMRKLIMEANNPLEEKLETLADLDNQIKEIEFEISNQEYAMHMFQVFMEMIEDYKYDSHRFENDADHYIYGGIEACGRMEDVVD